LQYRPLTTFPDPEAWCHKSSLKKSRSKVKNIPLSIDTQKTKPKFFDCCDHVVEDQSASPMQPQVNDNDHAPTQHMNAPTPT
ncbi:hypothetical protein PanWU01x14_241440, partial [Parasponia andersonii]